MDHATEQVQQRLAILGPLATVEEQVRQKELELAAAGLNLVGVNDKQRGSLLLYARAQAENTLVQNQAAIGVFNLDLATKAAGDTLQSWITRNLLDPSKPEQYAAAQTNLARSLRDTADAAKVAGSNLPGLQQAINDAGNFNKQLDQFATSSMTPVTAALCDINLGSSL